jgi:hypothetical protein
MRIKYIFYIWLILYYFLELIINFFLIESHKNNRNIVFYFYFKIALQIIIDFYLENHDFIK